MQDIGDVGFCFVLLNTCEILKLSSRHRISFSNSSRRISFSNSPACNQDELFGEGSVYFLLYSVFCPEYLDLELAAARRGRSTGPDNGSTALQHCSVLFKLNQSARQKS